jgi:hypothetical protein
VTPPDRTPGPPPSDGGRVVPNYALTRGRTRTQGVDLPLEALAVVTAAGQDHQARLPRERRAILQLCVRPTSVAEVAAHLNVPIGVARVLIGDLAANGHLAVHLLNDTAGSPDRAILERLLVGLRAR